MSEPIDVKALVAMLRTKPYPSDQDLARAADALEAIEKEREELREENLDLREAAKDCSGDDHGAFCRHYKGLKRRLAEAEEALAAREGR